MRDQEKVHTYIMYYVTCIHISFFYFKCCTSRLGLKQNLYYYTATVVAASVHQRGIQFIKLFLRDVSRR